MLCRKRKEKRAPNILIVDDDEGVIETFEFVFTDEGYNVFTALNPQEALKHFRENRIDVVLLDYNLPEMTGLEVLEKMQKMDPDVKVIIITGNVNFEKIKRLALNMNVKACFDKPPPIFDLIDEVKKLI